MQCIYLPNTSSSYHQILFVKINLTITLLSNIRFSKWSPNFWVSDQTKRMLFPHTRYMSPTSIFPNLIALTAFLKSTYCEGSNFSLCFFSFLLPLRICSRTQENVMAILHTATNEQSNKGRYKYS